MLIIESVMLMAFKRPARSVDLNKLDIGAQSFSQAGVIFKVLHLSKQSRVSKPWKISFTLGIQKINNLPSGYFESI